MGPCVAVEDRNLVRVVVVGVHDGGVEEVVRSDFLLENRYGRDAEEKDTWVDRVALDEVEESHDGDDAVAVLVEVQSTVHHDEEDSHVGEVVDNHDASAVLDAVLHEEVVHIGLCHSFCGAHHQSETDLVIVHDCFCMPRHIVHEVDFVI
jgi:hypothetical protein